MRLGRERLPGLLGLLIVAALFAALSAIASLEPVLLDGWNHFGAVTQFGDDLIAGLSAYSPGHTNPRIGQLFVRLSYFHAPVHSFLAPTMILWLFVVTFVLATGRWPRLADRRDMASFLSLSALIFLCVPHVGEMFFYRPFLANYVYGMTFTLTAFLPLRLESSTVEPIPHNRVCVTGIGCFLLGLPAGMSNEHTGPAALAAFLALWIARWRRQGTRVLAHLGGALGLAGGYAYLMLAHGQARRYGGLAHRVGPVETMLTRGLAGIGALESEVISATWPALALVAVAVLLLALSRQLRTLCAELRTPTGRRPLWTAAVLVVAAGVIVATINASPRQGDRLLFAPVLLMTAAAVAVVDLLAARPLTQTVLVILTVCYHCWFFAAVGGVYRQADKDWRRRLEILTTTPAGGVAVVPLFSQPIKTRLFLGDDLVTASQRAAAASHFRTLAGIELDRPNRVIEPPRVRMELVPPETTPSTCDVALPTPTSDDLRLDDLCAAFERMVRCRWTQGPPNFTTARLLTTVDSIGPGTAAPTQPAALDLVVAEWSAGRWSWPDSHFLKEKDGWVSLPKPSTSARLGASRFAYSLESGEHHPVIAGDGTRFLPWRGGDFLVFAKTEGEEATAPRYWLLGVAR